MCFVIAARECGSDEEDGDRAGTAAEVEGADEEADQQEESLAVQPKVALFKLVHAVSEIQRH